MNEIKKKWLNKLNALFLDLKLNPKIIFIANDETNRYYFDENDSGKFIMADCIFEIKSKLVSIQMMSNPNKEYRFSPDLKYFWEYDFFDKKRTKKDTNWPTIWKFTKKHLDNYNNKYNIFILLAFHADFRGSKNGIYAIEIEYIDDFLRNFNFNK